MMKAIIPFLSMVTLAALIPTTASAQAEVAYFTVDSIHYMQSVPGVHEVWITGGDEQLTDIIIPGEVFYHATSWKVLGFFNDAFAGHRAKSLSILATLGSNIDFQMAFEGCTRLERITVESGNPYFDSRDDCNAIIVTANNYLEYGCKTTVIPNSVKIIGSRAFASCETLTSITIPESVTVIKSDAFEDCTGLTSVAIPNSVTSIGSSAFNYCINLTSVTIGSSVVNIGGRAFDCCYNLKEITSKIVNVGDVTLGRDVFIGVDTSMCVLRVPKGTVEAYREADQWSAFVNIVEDADETVPGDLNGDGAVDGSDINLLIGIILDNANVSDNLESADISGDGTVDAIDLNILINIILGIE